MGAKPKWIQTLFAILIFQMTFLVLRVALELSISGLVTRFGADTVKVTSTWLYDFGFIFLSALAFGLVAPRSRHHQAWVIFACYLNRAWRYHDLFPIISPLSIVPYLAAGFGVVVSGFRTMVKLSRSA